MLIYCIDSLKTYTFIFFAIFHMNLVTFSRV